MTAANQRRGRVAAPRLEGTAAHGRARTIRERGRVSRPESTSVAGFWTVVRAHTLIQDRSVGEDPSCPFVRARYLHAPPGRGPLARRARRLRRRDRDDLGDQGTRRSQAQDRGAAGRRSAQARCHGVCVQVLCLEDDRMRGLALLRLVLLPLQASRGAAGGATGPFREALWNAIATSPTATQQTRRTATARKTPSTRKSYRTIRT